MRRAALGAALLLALATAPRAEPPALGGSLRLLLSQSFQEVAETRANPDNIVLRLPESTTASQARLNLSLDWERARVWAQPRFYATWERTRAGGETDRARDFDAILLQGGARMEVTEALFASFARENLQWGPAQLVNPSNPFFPRNGRENPMRELGGADFARLVWLPAPALTLSLIANTGEGEGPETFGGFRRSAAVKIDHTGEETSAGLLLHGGGEVPEGVSGYGQWTVSDALLTYGEFRAARGSALPYPVADAGPVGGHLEQRYEDSDRLFAKLLLGWAYTLEAGPTLTVEYFHNGEGFDGGEAELFAAMGGKAGDFVAAGLAQPTKVAGLGSTPLRRNYLMFQYLQTEILGKATALARWTRNLDDSSWVASFYGEWAAGDRITLFLNGAAFFGGEESEYGMAARYLAVAGAEAALF